MSRRGVAFTFGEGLVISSLAGIFMLTKRGPKDSLLLTFKWC
jgi:hypothetical protein